MTNESIVLTTDERLRNGYVLSSELVHPVIGRHVSLHLR